MGIVQAIVYGLVQGLTEFLPISSNAHIRIVPSLLGWQDPGAAFTAVIQLGTVAAVLIYFAKDLGAAIKGWAASIAGEGKGTPEARMGWAVFWGTLPIILIGLALHNKIETTFRSLYFIAFALIGMGVVMLLAEKLGKQTRKTKDVTVADGVKVGLWQVLAFIPGMSRSGSTISGALFGGFDRGSAARFSFLLSVPAVTAAGLYEAFKERHNFAGDLLVPTLVATVVSFAVGYASIAFLMKFLQKRGIVPFVAYRVLLGVVLLVLLSQGVLQPLSGVTSESSKPSAEGTAP
ncbi:MAG: undecaprenyl-diphosphatase UppP [Armatimonadetes bacterium 55-13]|nr:undecaprenyl-diphosphate phosphatase [Armatimonadota bacterium]OJU61532.1 MAG: undecaprenyl-diphosphatase UppP [Armatimonadetes bacterium 55-13]